MKAVGFELLDVGDRICDLQFSDISGLTTRGAIFLNFIGTGLTEVSLFRFSAVRKSAITGLKFKMIIFFQFLYHLPEKLVDLFLEYYYPLLFRLKTE